MSVGRFRRYGAYLFDLDGTLVDTAPDIGAALNHALDSHGYPPVGEALTRHWVGHGSRVLVEQALEHHEAAAALDDERHVASLLEAFLDHYEAHIADRSTPCPGAIACLEALGGDSGLAVVTNKLEHLSRRLLDALGLLRHFDVVIGGDTLAERKPAAAPALTACKHLGIAPTDALFVGDSETDIACARAAGCPVVCVRDGYNHGTPAARLGADAVIDSLQELV